MRKSHDGQWPGCARRPSVGRPGPGHRQARASGTLPLWAVSRGCLAASGPLSAPPTPLLPPCVASSSPKQSMENLMSEFQPPQRMWPDLHLLGSRAEPQGAGPGSPCSGSPGGHPPFSPPWPPMRPWPSCLWRSHSGTGCPRCLLECPQAGPAPSSTVPGSSRPQGHLSLEGFLEQVTRAEQSGAAGLPPSCVTRPPGPCGGPDSVPSWGKHVWVTGRVVDTQARVGT